MTRRAKAIIAIGVSGIMLGACEQKSSCGDPEVLQKVKELYLQQELGSFLQAAATAYALVNETATLVSIDRTSKVQLCNVVARVDGLTLLRLGNPMSDEDFKRAREKLSAQGQSAIQESLITYQIQPLASGQRYITVFPR